MRPTADGLVGKKAAHRVHVRRGALDQIAGLRLVVVGERQPLDVVEQVVAQPPRDAFRRLCGASRPLRKVNVPSNAARPIKASAISGSSSK